jgi:hypothetical protein
MQRKTGTRAFRDRMTLLRHLLAFLHRGGRIVSLELVRSDGIRHFRADHIGDDGAITWRTEGRSGRPAAAKRRGETKDERRRRLARERQARRRARLREEKEHP